MTEEKEVGELEKRKLNIPHICLDTVKHSQQTAFSTPSTPTGLRKSSSGRQNCLCSPTVHPGSFRCRYHRNGGGLPRSSISVGSRLSELNISVGTKLTELAAKPSELGDSLRSQQA